MLVHFGDNNYKVIFRCLFKKFPIYIPNHGYRKLHMSVERVVFWKKKERKKPEVFKTHPTFVFRPLLVPVMTH